MYKIIGGKNKVLQAIKQGYNIRFDKISDVKIDWNTYTNKDSISINTYFFENIYNWDNLKECNEALMKVFEHFDYMERWL